MLPPRATVLEVGCGSGQHAVHFAQHMPGLEWIPTDPDPAHRRSVAAWTAHLGLDNVAPPLDLDALDERWPVTEANAVYCANLIHIAPWSVTLGLLRGAARTLPEGGLLILYGPFRSQGRHTAESNERFDASLRAQDPRWGVRDLEDIATFAASQGLKLRERTPMPSNNLTLGFLRTSASIDG